MNTESPNTKLNTSLNHIQYRNEISSLDPSDPELSKKLYHLNKKYGFTNSFKNKNYKNHKSSNYQSTSGTENNQSTVVNNEQPQPQQQKQPQNNHHRRYNSFTNYPINFLSPYFGNFVHNQFDRVNSLFSKFQNHFNQVNGPLNFDNSTDYNQTEEYNNALNNHGTNGYTKYVSSFTTFDNGTRKGATVSGVTKTVNGKTTTSKKIRRIDGNVETVEQVFPDGRRTVTTNNVTERHKNKKQLTSPSTSS